MTLHGLTSSENAKCVSVNSSSTSSISSFCCRGRDVEVESGGDLWVVRVIKCNVIYYKCLSLVLLLAPHYEPPGETFTT